MEKLICMLCGWDAGMGLAPEYMLLNAKLSGSTIVFVKSPPGVPVYDFLATAVARHGYDLIDPHVLMEEQMAEGTQEGG